MLLRSPLSEPAVWMQLTVIALVTLGIRYLSARLRESSEGKAILVAALEQTRLQAEDILRNIRSGVVTVDSRGPPALRQSNGRAAARRRAHRPRRRADARRDRHRRARAVGRHSNAAESRIRTTRGEGLFVDTRRAVPDRRHDDVHRAATNGGPAAPRPRSFRTSRTRSGSTCCVFAPSASRASRS